MMFEAEIRDPAGRRLTIRREATDAAACATELRGEGALVLSIRALREESSAVTASSFSLRPISSFDLEMGLRQLASMIRSGVTLLTALEAVEAQASGSRVKALWSRIHARIFHGGALAEAFAAEGRRFGAVVIRLAEVGERTGELEKALTRAAEQLEARRNLRTTVINALVYPALTVLLAIGVSVYLVLSVIPRIGAFLSEGGVKLPPITAALLDFSAFVRAYGLEVFGACAALFVIWWAVRRFAAGREAEDAILLRLPVAGRILRLSGTALFARAMQIMSESGVTLLDSLKTSAALLENTRLRRRVECARDTVTRGHSLADALRPAKEFMSILPRMAAVGETTGALPEAFGETARLSEMMLAVAVKRFGLLIEPVMICVTGALVGFVYIAFFVALFAIAGTN